MFDGPYKAYPRAKSLFTSQGVFSGLVVIVLVVGEATVKIRQISSTTNKGVGFNQNNILNNTGP